MAAAAKVPSLQHMVRLWRPDAVAIQRAVVAIAENSPTFSYEVLFKYTSDMLLLGVPYHDIEKAVRLIKRPSVAANFLEILPLIRDYFAGIRPAFVNAVAPRYYPVGRNLLVPFRPPFVYGVEGELHLPWFSFWRANPIKGETLSLFVTIIDEIQKQDPDLEGATFKILDFSAVLPKQPRELRVIDPADVPRVTPERKLEMLELFAEGFALAQQTLAGKSDKAAGRDQPDRPTDDQPDLFK